MTKHEAASSSVFYCRLLGSTELGDTYMYRARGYMYRARGYMYI